MPTSKLLKISIGVLFVLGVVMIASVASAEDVNFTVTNYIVKVEMIPVGDVEGHALLLGERRGVASFENGDAAAYHTRFKCDMIKMLGPCEGYTDLTYMDKSQTFIKWQLTAAVPEGKKVPMIKGSGKYIKGTGKFEGIEGTNSFTGYYVTPYNEETKGDMVIKVSASYTLPAKQ